MLRTAMIDDTPVMDMRPARDLTDEEFSLAVFLVFRPRPKLVAAAAKSPLGGVYLQGLEDRKEAMRREASRRLIALDWHGRTGPLMDDEPIAGMQ